MQHVGRIEAFFGVEAWLERTVWVFHGLDGAGEMVGAGRA